MHCTAPSTQSWRRPDQGAGEDHMMLEKTSMVIGLCLPQQQTTPQNLFYKQVKILMKSAGF